MVCHGHCCPAFHPPGPIAIEDPSIHALAHVATDDPGEAPVSTHMVGARCNTSVAHFRDSGRQPTRNGATTELPGGLVRGTQETNSPCPNARAELRSTITCTCAKMATEDAQGVFNVVLYVFM